MRISIVTATYNSEATVRDTLQSVLEQSYGDIEYIVVDGGSSDATVDVVREFEPLFGGRMRWVSEPDGGIYDAMNKGIRMATGDVVGIINSDDFYHRRDVVERVAGAFAGDEGIDAVYGDIRFVSGGDLTKTVRYYSSRNFSPWRMRFGFMPAHPTFFTYRANFERLGYYRLDFKIAADFELLIRFLYKARLRTRYLAFDFMKMRLGGASTSGWASTLTLNREISRACRENGIWTCRLLLYMRYLIKIWEFVLKRN